MMTLTLNQTVDLKCKIATTMLNSKGCKCENCEKSTKIKRQLYQES